MNNYRNLNTSQGHLDYLDILDFDWDPFTVRFILGTYRGIPLVSRHQKDWLIFQNRHFSVWNLDIPKFCLNQIWDFPKIQIWFRLDCWVSLIWDSLCWINFTFWLSWKSVIWAEKVKIINLRQKMIQLWLICIHRLLGRFIFCLRWSFIGLISVKNASSARKIGALT